MQRHGWIRVAKPGDDIDPDSGEQQRGRVQVAQTGQGQRPAVSGSDLLYWLISLVITTVPVSG